MKAFLPIEITDAVLTSTTVPEVAPAAYVGGTTYASGDQVAVSGSAGAVAVYESLQNGNTGNAPASSAAWWKHVGDTYVEYASGTTYALADRVLDAANHWVYESAQAANTGHALTDTDWWNSVGPSNARAMFTYDHSLKTTAPSPITFTLTPGQRINCFQITGCTATQIEAVGTSVTGGGTVYSKTIALRKHEGLGWWRWLWGNFRYRRTCARFDLPSYSDLVLTVTITNGDGDVVAGKFGVGKSVYLGTVDEGARSRQIRASIISRDDYNELTLTKRRTAPEAEVTLYAEKRYFTSIDLFSQDCDAEPVFWSGLEESPDVYNDSLSSLGIARVFDVEELQGIVRASLTTEGI